MIKILLVMSSGVKTNNKKNHFYDDDVLDNLVHTIATFSSGLLSPLTVI